MRATPPRGRSRAAFTLIECCVTGAAAIVLAASLTGAMTRVSGEAMSAQDRANLQAIGQAAAMWSADNDGWIVGSPGTSGRDLLNDADALAGLALDLPHDATQPFDWAGPLAWNYLAPGAVRPERRDERFVSQFGGDPSNPTQPAQGALSVFHDPAQEELSIPFWQFLRPTGIDGTFFQPQLALSYVAAREFLWWRPNDGGGPPAWATEGFWDSLAVTGVLQHTNSVSAQHPLPSGRDTSVFPNYRPRMERIGDPASKIFIANGTRFQRPELLAVDHEVTPTASFGGAFADVGAFHVTATRAYLEGTDASGRDMLRTSFRRSDSEGNPAGHVLFYDGSVRLMSIDEARRPEWWLPRGTRVDYRLLDPALQPEYQQLVETGTNFVRIWK